MPIDPPPAVEESEVQTGPPPYRWHHKLGALLYVIVCFELGAFLLVFPWLDAWDINWFATYSPPVHALWMNPYVRGAISGLGLVDIYISFVEVFRLRRFASPRK